MSHFIKLKSLEIEIKNTIFCLADINEIGLLVTNLQHENLLQKIDRSLKKKIMSASF